MLGVCNCFFRSITVSFTSKIQYSLEKISTYSITTIYLIHDYSGELKLIHHKPSQLIFSLVVYFTHLDM